MKTSVFSLVIVALVATASSVFAQGEQVSSAVHTHAGSRELGNFDEIDGSSAHHHGRPHDGSSWSHEGSRSHEGSWSHDGSRIHKHSQSFDGDWASGSKGGHHGHRPSDISGDEFNVLPPSGAVLPTASA